MSSGDSLLLGRLLFRLRSRLQGLGDFLLGLLGLLIVEDLTLEDLVQNDVRDILIADLRIDPHLAEHPFHSIDDWLAENDLSDSEAIHQLTLRVLVLQIGGLPGLNHRFPAEAIEHF